MHDDEKHSRPVAIALRAGDARDLDAILRAGANALALEKTTSTDDAQRYAFLVETVRRQLAAQVPA